MGRCFLPPPAPANAVAAVESVVARIIADGLGSRSLAEPVRQHLGIDFSRSWALAYLRAAMLPVVLLLLLMVWGLTGIILINPDQRAVYERFGAPVAVLHPGAHLILPWPMGQVRRLEYGTIHETTLSGADMNQTIQRVGAEDTPRRTDLSDRQRDGGASELPGGQRRLQAALPHRPDRSGRLASGLRFG
jgi:hypothetical protein